MGESHLGALRGDSEADAEDRNTNVWHDPVEMGLRAPTIPEDTCRHENGAKNEEREAVLWVARWQWR